MAGLIFAPGWSAWIVIVGAADAVNADKRAVMAESPSGILDFMDYECAIFAVDKI
jgi:hypothetical protein